MGAERSVHTPSVPDARTPTWIWKGVDVGRQTRGTKCRARMGNEGVGVRGRRSERYGRGPKAKGQGRAVVVSFSEVCDGAEGGA